MYRGILLIPLTILATAAVVCGACWALHVAICPREMVLAAMIALLAGGFAIVPLILAAGASQFASAQAGLIATAAHLMVCLFLAGVLALSRVVAPSPLLLWMLPMYWASLVPVAIVAARAIRTARAETGDAAPSLR